jgi:hypothetical protein
MKVRCTKLLDTRGNELDRSAWLTIGKVYHVLSVVLDVHGRWLLRLMGDSEPGVGFFSLHQFEIVSQRIPPSWIVTWNEVGVFELTPEAWSASEFWDRFFEHDPEAQRTFKDEMQRIVAADP